MRPNLTKLRFFYLTENWPKTYLSEADKQLILSLTFTIPNTDTFQKNLQSRNTVKENKS